MMPIFTLEQLDFMFFEKLRLALVAKLWLPDITQVADKTEYIAARDAMRLSGVLVDILGVGTDEAKDEKTAPRIVVSRKGTLKGEIAAPPGQYHKRVNSLDNIGEFTFSKVKYPDFSRNVLYEVRCITTSTQRDREVNQVVMDTLGMRRFLTIYNGGYVEQTDSVFVEFTGEVDVSAGGFLERVHRYEVQDVFLQTEEVTKEGIPRLTTVNPGLYVFKSNIDNPTEENSVKV